MSGPTAYASVPSLLTSLQRAGWGDLAGREWQGVRTTLHALAAQLPHKSGQGWSTAEQVAQAAGLSSRWVRRCLALLEDMGVVEWRRGGVIGGEPAPSWFRIVKSAVVDLIRAARPVREAADAARRTATRARIAAARALRRPDRRPRRSVHAELSASPPTPTGEDSRPTSSPEVLRTSPARSAGYIPVLCEHDSVLGQCPSCRRQKAQAS